MVIKKILITLLDTLKVNMR